MAGVLYAALGQMDKDSHRCMDFHSIVDITEPDPHPRPHARPAAYEFLPVKATFSSGSSLEFAALLGSRMNLDVKLEQVRDSFPLEIFGESVTHIAQSCPKSLQDDSVQVSRHICQDESAAQGSPDTVPWPATCCDLIQVTSGTSARGPGFVS